MPTSQPANGPAGQLVALHDTLPPRDMTTSEEKKKENNPNIHAGCAACLTNTQAGSAAFQTIPFILT